MSREAYAAALMNSLNEIRNICPDVRCSFIFTKNGVVVAGDEEASHKMVEKAVRSFQGIAEKADMVGGLDTFLIEGESGKVYISCADDMHLAIVTSKNADISYLRSVTRVIVPTILRLLKSIIPTPLKFVPPQQLIVEPFGGFFAGDTLQVDREILTQWSQLLDGKEVLEVEIESFSRKRARCRVKATNDPDLQGKGLIRIPEKTCRMLEVKKGELVRVKPIEYHFKIPLTGVKEINI